MQNSLQLTHLHREFDKLHQIYGDTNYRPIYGTGCTKNPKFVFVFMNPTAKNISSRQPWSGIQAPWIGTKNVWKLFYKVGILNQEIFDKTQQNQFWSENFAEELYKYLTSKKVYITNLAKCTQIDAKPLKDKVFKDYLELMYQELLELEPEHVILFGNQVNSIILNKKVSVSNYQNLEHEFLNLAGKNIKCFPMYYPVGMGMMNMPKVVKSLKLLINDY